MSTSMSAMYTQFIMLYYFGYRCIDVDVLVVPNSVRV